MSNFIFSVLVLIAGACLLGGCSSEKTGGEEADSPYADHQEQTETVAGTVPDTSAGSEVEEELPGKDLPASSPEPEAEPLTPPEPDGTKEPAEESPDTDMDPPAEPPTTESTDPEPEEPEETGSSNVIVPAEPVRVEAKEGLTYVGTDRCAKCHKVQHASWLESPHATLTHPLDCEGCHGPGSAYRSLKIMKDPKASRAAGLVDPRPDFCAKCHVAGWEEDMLQAAHAHKPPADD